MDVEVVEILIDVIDREGRKCDEYVGRNYLEYFLVAIVVNVVNLHQLEIVVEVEVVHVHHVHVHLHLAGK